MVSLPALNEGVQGSEPRKANTESIRQHGRPHTLRIMCSVHVQVISNPADVHLNNRELKQQAQDADQENLRRTMESAAAHLIETRKAMGRSYVHARFQVDCAALVVWTQKSTTSAFKLCAPRW